MAILTAEEILTKLECEKIPDPRTGLQWTLILLGAIFSGVGAGDNSVLLQQIKDAVDGLEALNTTLNDQTDGLEGFTDGLEGLITSLNALVTTGNAQTDGVEGLLTSIETLVTTLNGQTDGLEGFTDGLEGLLTALNALVVTGNAQTDGIETLLGTLNSQTDAIEGSLSTITGHVDGVEAALATLTAGVVISNTPIVVLRDANGNNVLQSNVNLAATAYGVPTRIVPEIRTWIRIFGSGLAAAATGTDAMLTLTKSSGGALGGGATSFTVTNGKKFRITHMAVSCTGNSVATAQNTLFRLRSNSAGATVVGSNQMDEMKLATPATASIFGQKTKAPPEGIIEFTGDGSLSFGVSAVSTYTTNAPTLDVEIVGYEY